MREFLDLSHGPTQNADGMSSLMTDDVVWHINMPLARAVVGREAARVEIERQNTISSGMLDGSEVLRVVSDGATVFTERIEINEINGRQVTFHINGVFEIRDGKIAAWRDYFDTCDMALQLGLPMGIDPRRLYPS